MEGRTAATVHKEVDDVSRRLKTFNFNDIGENAEILETIRRVVSLMTLGFDVSSLFPDIIKVSESASRL